jgi:glycosyltransferase involved in cell wall biosynthesis
MGFGNCVVVRDTSANSAVVADAGVKFENAREIESLSEKLNYLIENPDVVEEYRGKAVVRVKDTFGWGEVADKYEELFRKLVVC